MKLPSRNLIYSAIRLRFARKYVIRPLGWTFGVVGVVFLTYFFLWDRHLNEQDLDRFLKYRPVLSTRIFDITGNIIIELPGISHWALRTPEYRRWVTYDEIPPLMRNALLAAEDQRFMSHNGIDYWSLLLRVPLETLTESLRKTLRTWKPQIVKVQGASTIDQQTVQLVYFDKVSGARSLFQKFQKMRMALQLNRDFHGWFGKRAAKKRIFEIFANASYFGESRYGIDAAAEHFFGRKLSDFNNSDLAPEAALLAGMIRSSVKYSPRGDVQYEARARRNGILKIMADVGFIDRENLAVYQRALIKTSPADSTKTIAPAVVQYVLKSQFGKVGEPEVSWRGGITIRTTVNLEAQKNLNEAVAYGVALYRGRQIGRAHV